MIAEAWLARVRDAEQRGELLEAVDLADQGLAEAPDDSALQHRAALALARAGATETAARRLLKGQLAVSQDPDVLALRARIAKDRALRVRGAERRLRAAEAAACYAAIGGWYPLVNAATLNFMAGNADGARAQAKEVLRLLADEPQSYFAVASEAEALLVLGRDGEAGDALERAAAMSDDRGAQASTYRQLALLCEERGVGVGLLSSLRGPGVLHFCGHLPGERFPPESEAAVTEAIEQALARRPVGAGYGALAAGGDILVAEALLRSGAGLHVVLPCSRDAFTRTSVAPAGADWVERFDRCMAAAQTVRFATEEASEPDDVLLRYGAELAMGLALLRARWLHADVRQLAVWDGGPAGGEAGTARDVGAWRHRGKETVVVTPPGGQAPDARPVTPSSRKVYGLLVGDVRAYSKLPDEAMPRFAESVMGAFATVLDQQEESVVLRNSWGDALLVAVRNAEAAARVALSLQRAMERIDLDAADLPPDLSLRLAGHVGPVFVADDPVRRAPGIVGSHINRAARIEPVTPPGEVYVTEAFAAKLELMGTPDLACDYVGHLPAAKDAGRMRMHRLHDAR